MKPKHVLLRSADDSRRAHLIKSKLLEDFFKRKKASLQLDGASFTVHKGLPVKHKKQHGQLEPWILCKMRSPFAAQVTKALESHGWVIVLNRSEQAQQGIQWIGKNPVYRETPMYQITAMKTEQKPHSAIGKILNHLSWCNISSNLNRSNIS